MDSLTGENVVHEGFLWIQDARNDSWARKKCWLTSAGGLFYNSDRDQNPCARQVMGLWVSAIDIPSLSGRFGFEVIPPGTGAVTSILLAAETSEGRADWIRQLQAFQDGSGDSPSLSPLDVFQGAGHRRNSRRMSHSDLTVAPYEVGAVPSEALVKTPGVPVAQKPQVSRKTSMDRLGCPMPPMRSGPEVRRNSQCAFAEKSNTTLVLDWDDTLFPTTWIRSDCHLNWKLPLDQQLEPGPRKTLIQALLAKHLERALVFLQEASLYATVFIVTLARRPWVEMSMANFMPGLISLIEALNLKILYAQEYVGYGAQEYMRDEFMSNEESLRFWSRVKGECISRELDELHDRSGISWKNVISFGDSDFERLGTIAAGEDYIRREMEGGTVLSTGATAEGISKYGHLKKLRTKTMKMLNEPTVEELTAELSVLTMWLPHIVKQDSGFDHELESSEDDVKLRQLHKVITGADTDISWTVLAGMTDA